MIKSLSQAPFAFSFATTFAFASIFVASLVMSQENAGEIKSQNNKDVLPTVVDDSDLFGKGSQPMPRGPVHEAFAEPVQLTPLASPVIEEKPPVDITETPANRPSGADMQWIEGYWGWNENVEKYLWVSGVWRKTPPGRRWEAGRWDQTDGGHQWVPGSWLPQDTETAAVSGFQNVPESVEAGPNQPEPDDSFWVPGNWKPTETPAEETPPGISDGYSWRPGSWSPAYDDWVWVPEHYSWTPEGCRMVAGYWDYPWLVRGTMHACCEQPTENYEPVALNTEDRFTKLWTDPQTGSYYYGDYYGKNNPGYMPWHQYHQQNRGYDPLYCHYSRVVGPRVGGDFCSYLDSRYAYNQSACCGGDGRGVLRSGGNVGRAVAASALPIAAATAAGGSSGGAAVTSATTTTAGSTAAPATSAAGAASNGTSAVNPATNAASSAMEAANPIANPLDNINGDGDGEGEEEDASSGSSAPAVTGGAATNPAAAAASAGASAARGAATSPGGGGNPTP